MEHTRTIFHFKTNKIKWTVDYQVKEGGSMVCRIYKNDILYHTFENVSTRHVNKTEANRFISKSKKLNVREDIIDKLLK